MTQRLRIAILEGMFRQDSLVWTAGHLPTWHWVACSQKTCRSSWTAVRPVTSVGQGTLPLNQTGIESIVLDLLMFRITAGGGLP